MRIAFLLTHLEPGRVSPIFPEVLRLLAEYGAAVEAIYPDDPGVDAADARVAHDLYVLKAKSEAALRYAKALDSKGARTLNPYPVTALCRDKIATTEVLGGAGVPVPPTYVETDGAALSPLLDDGPLIVKPYRGSQGRGIQVVRTAEDLRAVSVGSEPAMAQRYLEPDGRDRKVYRIGEEFFCVKRVWPPTTYAEKLGEVTAVDDELREVAAQCGTALGIDLYGVDVIFSGGRPFVVDLSSFPGFKGVPQAARRLSEYIYAAADESTLTERL